MAAGDIVWFDQAMLDLGKEVHDLTNDTLKLGIVKSAANAGIDPVASTADPRWGAGGSTNLSSSEVATGGSSYTGPQTLTTKTWTLVSGKGTLRADVVSLAQDASGFTNGRWGILYNDTAAGKQALAYVDLGSDRSLVTGPLTIDWNGATNDILTLDSV
jgi:hypothetical protein